MFPDGFAHLLPNAAVWHGQENGSLFVWFFYLHFLLKSRTGKGNDFWMCDKQIENETRCEDVVLSTCRSWHVAFLVFFFFFSLIIKIAPYSNRAPIALRKKKNW